MGLLPVFTGLLAYWVLRREHARSLAMGLAALLVYTWCFLSVEGLSALGLLARMPLSLSWSAPLLGLMFWRLRQGTAPVRYAHNFSTGQRILLGWTLLAGSLTLLCALYSAPNNWDSMSYHLSRVANWAARASVEFYPTGINRQLSQPPASEYAMLHFYLLSANSDRLLNLLQWLAALAAAAACWRLALHLHSAPGAEASAGSSALALRSAVWSVFLFSCMPMALLQASSTQNDLVLAALLLWTLTFGLEYLRESRRKPAALWALCTALCAAMAWLSKGTAWIYFPPLLGLLLFLAWRVKGNIVWRLAGLSLLLIVLFNAPHALRNQAQFGSILGPDYALSNELRRVADVPAAALANASKNAAHALRGPVPALNALLERSVHALHGLLAKDVNQFEWHWAPSPGFSVPDDRAQLLHEDYAPNTLPAWLLLFTLAALVLPSLTPGRHASSATLRRRKIFAGLWILLFVLFSVVLRWQIWHSRLLLPLFVLAAPLIACWMAERRAGIRVAAALLLMAGAMPLLLFNRSRPVLGSDSMFNKSRVEQYFVNRPELLEPYQEAARLINSHSANNVVLYFSGDSWEYPLWALSKTTQPLQSAGRDATLLTHLAEADSVPPPELILSWWADWNEQPYLQMESHHYERQGPPPVPGAPGVFRRVEQGHIPGQP